MRSDLIHTPEGVRDIYGKEYADKLKIQEVLHKHISLYGYQDIQTPTFEFFDVFGKEIGTTPAKELFKFFDSDGNILCLRPDFTPSMARCAAKYFTEESMPIRLSYQGNTFSNTSLLQGKLKETTQMGAELMGDDTVEADAEIIAMLIDALCATGLEEFQVSIGEIDYFKGLCEEFALTSGQEEYVRDYIFNKNFLAAKEYLQAENLPVETIGTFMKMEDMFGGIDMLIKAEQLSEHPLCKKALQRLTQLYKLLESYGVEKYVSFDLGMLSRYQYYTGIIFKVYAFGVGDVIVKGGRYDKLLPYFGKDSAAIGFVIVVDDLMQALKRQKVEIKSMEDGVVILYSREQFSKALAKAKDYRNKGVKVQLLLFNHEKTIDTYREYAMGYGYESIINLTEEEEA